MANVLLIVLAVLVVIIGAIVLFVNNGFNKCPEATTLAQKTKPLKKTVLITGANGGIGLATTQALAEIYDTIIMACRNVESGNKICKELKQEHPTKTIIVEKLDLANMKQIRQFCENIRNNKQIKSINTIICNAGVWPQKEKQATKDGFELATGTNHLGHMLMVMSLKDLLFKDGSIDDPSRLIVVSGDIYKTLEWKGSLPKLDDNESWNKVWNMDSPNVYSHGDAYSMSKLCNIWFANQFAEKYCDNGKCIAVSLHPGVGATNLLNERDNNGAKKGYNWMNKNVAIPIFGSFGDNPMQLAYTQCWLAVTDHKNIKNGCYYRGEKEYPVSKAANDAKYAQKMWHLSVELIEKTINDKIPNL